MLTGTCFVGNQSTGSLMALVIIPQLIYLSVGCILLLLGFRALLKSPSPAAIPALQPQVVPHNPHLRKDSAEEVNLLRLGIFAVIYTVPTAFIIASWLYEYFSRDAWLAAAKPSLTPSIAPKPSLWVFLLRILMLQILGVLTSFWVMSREALRSWKTVFGRMGPPTYKPAPLKCLPQQIPIHYYATPQIHTVPKRTHSHSKYPAHSHNGSHRKPRLHHGHQLPLPGGETMLWNLSQNFIVIDYILSVDYVPSEFKRSLFSALKLTVKVNFILHICSFEMLMLTNFNYFFKIVSLNFIIFLYIIL